MNFGQLPCEFLSDCDYAAFCHEAIREAQERILVQQFLINASPSDDKLLLVRRVLLALADANRMGVDVRVILPQIERDESGWDLNEVSARFLKARGVSVRSFRRTDVQLHQKIIVADDLIIAGSHNWTPGAFSSNSELSVAVSSEDVSSYYSSEFERWWASASFYNA
jgi:phosphatidylserine/phosphatidylglycerophosphate/cardiolipin synthase-like enzyme